MSDEEKELIYQTFSGILYLLKQQAQGISRDDANELSNHMNLLARQANQGVQIKIDASS
jgi:hypothetical protein